MTQIIPAKNNYFHPDINPDIWDMGITPDGTWNETTANIMQSVIPGANNLGISSELLSDMGTDVHTFKTIPSYIVKTDLHMASNIIYPTNIAPRPRLQTLTNQIPARVKLWKNIWHVLYTYTDNKNHNLVLYYNVSPKDPLYDSILHTVDETLPAVWGKYKCSTLFNKYQNKYWLVSLRKSLTNVYLLTYLISHNMIYFGNDHLTQDTIDTIAKISTARHNRKK